MIVPEIRAKWITKIDMPVQFSRLRDIAYNLWWSWNPSAQALFELIGQKVTATGTVHEPTRTGDLRPLLRVKEPALDRDLPILLAMVTAVGAAWVSHELGLSPVLGAFVAGLLLGRPGHEGLVPSKWVASLVGGNGGLKRASPRLPSMELSMAVSSPTT